MTDTQIAVTVWAVVGFGLIALEIAMSGMIVFMIGLGALCTALLTWIFGLELTYQLIIFAVASTLALVLLRRTFYQALHGKSVEADRIANISSLAGARGVVSTEIPPHGNGKINCRGSFWTAYAESDQALPAGTNVEIIKDRTPDDPRVQVKQV